MAATRFYSSTAGQMFLSGAITSGATSATLTAVTGLPSSLPYTLLLDPGLATEEVVECTAIGGSVVTITRGMDGSSAQAHASGAEVRHGFSARDFQDSRNHEANTTTAHGVAGAVAGTTSTQTFTNKTMSGSSNTFSNIAVGSITNGVSTTNTVALTNKTIDAVQNTILNAPPSGTITMFGGVSAPTGYLMCDGSAVSRTGANALLFAAIGVAYGAGDGSTTFNVPNFASAFPRGNTPASNGGAATHLHNLTSAAVASHTHASAAHAHTLSSAGQACLDVEINALMIQRVVATFQDNIIISTNTTQGSNVSRPNATALMGNTDSATPGATGAATPGLTGTTDANNNLPPYIGVNFIIKL
jgi:microcystin-dependent protein